MLINRSSALTISATAVIQVINAVNGILLARLLGPSDRGVLAALIVATSLLAAACSLSLGDAVAYHVARGRVDPGVVAAEARHTALRLAALGAALAIIMAFVARLVWDSPGALTLLLTLLVPMGVVTSTCSGWLIGSRRFVGLSALRVIEVAALGLATLTVAALVNFTVATAATAYVVAGFVAFVAALLIVAKGGAAGTATRSSSVRGPDLLRFGRHVHAANLLPLVGISVDQAVIGWILGASALGLFVVANAFPLGLLLLGSSLALVAFPTIAKSAGERPTLREWRPVILMFVSVAIVLAALLPVLIPVFFGEAFSGAVPPAMLLVPAAALTALVRLYGSAQKGLGEPGAASFGELTSIAVRFTALVIGLPLFGLVFTGVAGCLGAVASLLVMMLRARPGSMGVPS